MYKIMYFILLLLLLLVVVVVVLYFCFVDKFSLVYIRDGQAP